MEPRTKCVLICDTRERYVLKHEKELEKISYETKQITTGDYVVLSPEGNILAVIERKSLDDFAASLKDARHLNKRKLVELRAQTNCRIVYIIEGPEFPSPSDLFGNIPYKHIESSIFHLMVRDGVSVIRARNTLDTAKTLARFMQSMDSLCGKLEEPIERAEPAPLETITGACAEPTERGEIIALLTKKQEKTDHEVVRELWACFPGIAVESADEYMKTWCLSDIVCGKIPRAEIDNFKLASGRKIGKKAAGSLQCINKLIQTRLLSHVPGVSAPSAQIILETATLPSLLTWGANGLGTVIMTKNKRRVGNVIAERILRLFSYKYVSSMRRGDQISIENISIDDSDISALLDLC